MSTKLTDFEPMQKELLRLKKENNELVNVLNAYRNMVGNTGYSIAKEEAKYLYEIANNLIAKIDTQNKETLTTTLQKKYNELWKGIQK